MIKATATVIFELTPEVCTVSAECVSLKTVISKIQNEIDKESDYWFDQWKDVVITITRGE